MTTPEKTFLITGGTKESRVEKCREIIGGDSSCMLSHYTSPDEIVVVFSTQSDIFKDMYFQKAKEYAVKADTQLPSDFKTSTLDNEARFGVINLSPITYNSACLIDEIKALIETTVKVQTHRDSRFTIKIEGKAYPVSKRTKLIYSEITNPKQKTPKEKLDGIKAIAITEPPTPSSGYKPLYNNVDALMREIVNIAERKYKITQERTH